MKGAAFYLALATAGTQAQDLTSLPECGQTCVNNILTEASNLGCPTASAACLCGKPGFAYGIADCASESCPPGSDIDRINAYGVSYCQSAQASASGATLSALSIFSSAAGAAASASTAAAGGPGSSPASGSSSSPVAITTIPVISTTVSDDSTIETTLGSSTIYAGQTLSSNDTSTATGNSSQSLTVSSTPVTTVPVVSTVTQGGTTRETTIGSSTQFSETTISPSSSAGVGAAGIPMPVKTGVVDFGAAIALIGALVL